MRKFLLILVPCIAAAQQARITSPMLGYLFDEEGRGIRSISGIPGEAALEGALPAGFSIEQAFVSPSRAAAVARSKEDSTAVVVRWNAGAVKANFTNAFALFLQRDSSFGYGVQSLLAHEIFHTWNPYRMGAPNSSTDMSWFTEGLPDTTRTFYCCVPAC